MGQATLPPVLHAAGNYFATPDGKSVYLAGSHTWTNVQDIGATFDNAAYLSTLSSFGMNFTRLWAWESAKDGGSGAAAVNPLPWASVGTKYDLSNFDQSYFDRLRSRVLDAGNKGIYVSVMLFQGWSVQSNGASNDPWLKHPFNAANNINGINGDPGNTGTGVATHTLNLPSVWPIQQSYITKVLATISDLPNVLLEVGNEMTDESNDWQNAVVDYIHDYEKLRGGLQHPVGITAAYPTASESGANSYLYNSHADWISPSGISGGYRSNSPVSPGSKVVLLDTDHLYGVGGDGAWVWRQFMRGYNVLYMDDMSGTGVSGTLDLNLSNAQIAQEKSARIGIQETRQVSSLVDLSGMKPSTTVSSTGYALANPTSGQYIAYASSGGSFTMDLSGATGKPLDARWMNLATGQLSSPTVVTAGPSRQPFSSPYGATGSALILTPASGPPPATSPQDRLVLHLSADAWQGNPQFVASLDGKRLGTGQIGASRAAGQTEEVAYQGSFAAGRHDLALTFNNDAWGGNLTADRNLYVHGVECDGAPAPVALFRKGTVHFRIEGSTVARPADDNTLVLRLSADAWQGGAQFIASIDGKRLAAAPAITASSFAGETQDVIFKGDFGVGPHDLAISFINDAWGGSPDKDRNLYVNGVEYEGVAAPVALMRNGTVHFQVTDDLALAP